MTSTLPAVASKHARRQVSILSRGVDENNRRPPRPNQLCAAGYSSGSSKTRQTSRPGKIRDAQMSRGLQRMRAERRRLSTLDRTLARSRIWPAPHFFPELSRGLDKRRTRYPSPVEKSKDLRKGRRRESRRRMMSHFNGKSPVHRPPSCYFASRLFAQRSPYILYLCDIFTPVR